MRAVPRSLRLVAAAMVGAAFAAAVVVAAFRGPSRIAIEFDRELPAGATGFYGVERDGGETFVWTAEVATLVLAHVDRDVAWRCDITMRSARLPGQPVPRVSVAVDGIAGHAGDATPDYATVGVQLPPRPGRPGFTLTLATTPTVRGGPEDPRALGVRVDRIICAPATEGQRASAPAPTLATAAIAGAAFSVLAVWLGLGLAGMAGAAGVSVGAAIALSTGLAPYGAFADLTRWVAGVIVGLALAGAGLARGALRRPLGPEAAAALLVVTAAAWLKCLGLLHPDKAIVDAAFHAHRLQGVLAGGYYFTQPLPDGVSFPYAIGLYVAALPFTWITTDFVTLLRVLTVVAEAGATLALYAFVSRTSGDRLAAIGAAALFVFVPLPFVVIGNANLTFAFGQSLAVIALASAATWAAPRMPALHALALTGLASAAYLSHVAVFPALAVALVAFAVTLWFDGDPARRRSAWRMGFAAAAGAVVAVASYYGHFSEVYASFERVIGQAPAQAAPSSAAEAVSRLDRLGRAATLAVQDWGWPLVTLAVAGALAGAGRRNNLLWRFVLAVLLTYAVFVLGGLAAPVEPRFVRYADEFVSRMNMFAAPALACLGGLALARLSAASGPGRWLALGMLSAAAWLAGRAWLVWFT